jgi:CRP/FNR family transcriptional regulator, anaerobic regulatory protein
MPSSSGPNPCVAGLISTSRASALMACMRCARVHCARLNSPDGAEQTVGFYMPGELLGLDGLAQERHGCGAVALETSSVCELPLKRLEELCAKVPGFHRQMMRLIGKEVSNEHQNLLLLSSRTAEERIATFLLSLSTRFGQRGFSATEFNLSMSRHEIANFLGLAPETVSRQLSNFHNKGTLSVEGRRITIHDLDRLRTMVEPCLNRPVPDPQLSRA